MAYGIFHSEVTCEFRNIRGVLCRYVVRKKKE